MIVVSNTSVILNLALVGHLDLLEKLYGRVLAPRAVLQELVDFGLEKPDVNAVQTLSWIEARSVTHRSLSDWLLSELDIGEAEAIALAVEVKADLLLLDERLGHKIASRLGLSVIGLLGVLLNAKRRGFLAGVRPVLDAVIAIAGFWVSRLGGGGRIEVARVAHRGLFVRSLLKLESLDAGFNRDNVVQIEMDPK